MNWKNCNILLISPIFPYFSSYPYLLTIPLFLLFHFSTISPSPNLFFLTSPPICTLTFVLNSPHFPYHSLYYSTYHFHTSPPLRSLPSPFFSFTSLSFTLSLRANTSLLTLPLRSLPLTSTTHPHISILPLLSLLRLPLSSHPLQSLHTVSSPPITPYCLFSSNHFILPPLSLSITLPYSSYSPYFP